MRFPITRFIVKGKSMEPNFRAGQYVLVNRWARNFVPGDVVVLHDPREQKREMLKRVVATGDGGYIVSGDNRTHSTDSRIFGPVTKCHILGKVLVKI